MKVERFWIALLAAAALALLGLALAPSTALAGPAYPGDRVIEQPDGTTVTVRVWGDEWNHGMETAEGYSVLRDAETGYLVYADLQPDGTLAPALVNGSPLVVGRDDPAPLAPGLRPAPVAPPERRLAPIRPGAERDPAFQAFRGAMPVLVILADFSNQTHHSGVPVNYWKEMFFGASHSIKDFYNTASFGALDLSPARETHGPDNDGIVGWVKLPIAHPDGSVTLSNSNGVARAALQAANSYVNYASFDRNSDGYVTGDELQVVIIAAGFEGSYDGDWYRRMWAHQWDLDANPLRLDGKYLAQNTGTRYGGYAILGELFDVSLDWDGDGTLELPAEQYTPLQMGTPTHEFGHLLSWPDLYNVTWTSSDDPEGVGEWSLMGSASWNTIDLPGDTPALPDAWSKWYQGWITPTRAVSGVRNTVGRSDTNAQAYLVGANPNGVDWNFFRQSGRGEYWLVENRQRNGYDAALKGCGLLIWHINEAVTSTNYANADSWDPLVALEQADGRFDLENGAGRGDDSDPWPGTSGRTAFNNASTPNTHTNQDWGTKFDISVENRACASAMYFTFTLDTESFYLPSTFRWAVNATGTVTDNGAAAANQPVELMVSPAAGQPFARAATTTTDAAGRYAFTAPIPGHGGRYYVRWLNPSSSYNNRLYSFACGIVNASASPSACNFNIHDVKMLEPPAGETVSHPFIFTWVRRSTDTDSYTVELYDADQNYIIELDNDGPPPDGIGYWDRATVSAAPPGTTINTKYYWSTKVYTPSGTGYGFYVREIRWRDLSGPALADPAFGPGAPWGEGQPPLEELIRPAE